MVKVIALLKRKPGMSREEFERRWLVEHTKLSSKLPGCREYRINLCLPEQPGSETAEPLYDGTAELWWDSIEQMEQCFAGETARIAGEDADSFCELRIHLYTREYLVVHEGRPVQPPREAS